MAKKENLSEFIIEPAGWTLDYAFSVVEKGQRHLFDPYIDALGVELTGTVLVPSSPPYAEVKLTMGDHDGYTQTIETEAPHPVIGHLDYQKPVLGGRFWVPQRTLSLLLYAIDRQATRYLYVHSEPLKRNRAHIRYVSFKAAADLEDNFDPT